MCQKKRGLSYKTNSIKIVQIVNKSCIKPEKLWASTSWIECCAWCMQWYWLDLHHYQSYLFRAVDHLHAVLLAWQQYPTFHSKSHPQLPRPMSFYPILCELFQSSTQKLINQFDDKSIFRFEILLTSRRKANIQLLFQLRMPVFQLQFLLSNAQFTITFSVKQQQQHIWYAIRIEMNFF